MARLLGRTPRDQTRASFFKKKKETDEGKGNEEAVHNEETAWRGSGLGSDWDEKVGAGAAAASIVGRLAFAAWKIIAEEVKHANASYLPAVVSAVMSKRIPHHDELTLTHWYASGNERWRVLNHRLTQATSYLLLFDALDIIGRAGEAARLSGVEFSQSFPGIRGSQYKVEGVLLRALQSLRSDERGSKRGKARKGEELTEKAFGGSTRCSNDTRSPTQEPWKFRREGKATLENRHYFFFSSSSEDANKQEALEVQALTLEPQSGHYTDPVVVCDFTALYPSLVIAYNLCYSTCAGKLEYHSTRREMHLEGRMSGHVGPFLYPERRTATILADHMQSLKDFTEEDANTDRAYVAPTGTVYVSENVLKGILPLVLEEILTTRAMLKKAAKEYKKNVKNLSPAILRQLEARQLALKYVANVTYGEISCGLSLFRVWCKLTYLFFNIRVHLRNVLRQIGNASSRRYYC
jgi:DNA polymerase zeta